mmetsp:Transcript_19265/g.39373  ORF Transcript_19265/g.39373 Transcript_19265/m.39373 type:complete len:95 (-) Transcript_19265:93-377(-)
MLHCCEYGIASVALDGRPAARIHASLPGFPHHVVQVSRLGTLDVPGKHTLSLRVIGARPNATHQFRLAWLHVSSPLHGQDSEYKLTSTPSLELL